MFYGLISRRNSGVQTLFEISPWITISFQSFKGPLVFQFAGTIISKFGIYKRVCNGLFTQYETMENMWEPSSYQGMKFSV